MLLYVLMSILLIYMIYEIKCDRCDFRFVSPLSRTCVIGSDGSIRVCRHGELQSGRNVFVERAHLCMHCGELKFCASEPGKTFGNGLPTRADNSTTVTCDRCNCTEFQAVSEPSAWSVFRQWIGFSVDRPQCPRCQRGHLDVRLYGIV